MAGDFKQIWHLAKQEEERLLTEFEFAYWRTFYSFCRWQEDCQHYICGSDLTGQEIAILHIIRMNEQPKTVYEISRLLNRDDHNNVLYTIRKLVKMGLAERLGDKKHTVYQATAKGIKNTDLYREAKKDILIKLLKKFCDDKKIQIATDIMIRLQGIYDEASKTVVSYGQNWLENNQ